MNIDPDLFTAKVDLLFHGVFFVLLLAFTIHAIILGYHWFTYGRDRRISMLALAIYLIGGATFFLTMAALIL